LRESSESARLRSEVAPQEAVTLAHEATVALARKGRGEAKDAISEKEVEIVRALADVLLPKDVRASSGGAEVDPAALLVDFTRGWPVEYRLALRASLRFIEYAPIVFQIKPVGAKLPITPFTGLPAEDRERVCRRLDEAHSHHVRSLFKIAKVLVYGVYYAHPSVSRAVGYDSFANKEAAEAFARSLGR